MGIAGTLSARSLAALKKISSPLYYEILKMIKAIDSLDDITAPGSTELTISSGSIAVSGIKSIRYLIVDTEDNAASDELSSITGAGVGEIIILSSASDSRIVTVKNSSNLNLQANCILNSTSDKIILISLGGNICDEMGRSSNG